MFLHVLFSLTNGIQTATVKSAFLKPMQVRYSVEEEGGSEILVDTMFALLGNV